MDKQKDKHKQWRQANKEHVQNYRKIYYKNNKEQKSKNDAVYRKQNWDKIKQRHNTWRRAAYKKMKEDKNLHDKFLAHKIKSNCSRRIREILCQKKSLRCMTYVGCSLEKLRFHLESQFTDGMSWKNYGQSQTSKQVWHIDHIIPCAAFDMTNDIHVKACFHYRNLQPLWEKQNIQKKDQYEQEALDIYMKNFIEIYIL